MNKYLSTLSLLVLAACGTENPSPTEFKGAPHNFPVACGLDSDSSFRIYEGQGLLRQYNQSAVRFNCEQVVSLDEVSTKKLWSCSESNSADGYQVNVYKNSSGIFASVATTRNGAEIARLICQ